MGVLTRTARFVSSHDLQRDAGLHMSLRLSSRILCHKNEFESHAILSETTPVFFDLQFNNCFACYHIDMLYGSCKSARLKRRCLDARRNRSPRRCPVMMNWGWWSEQTPPLRNISTGNLDSEYLSFPGWWLYSPVFSSLRL